VSFTKSRLKIGGILLTLILVGLALRLHNLSSYLFYPDSYQSITVAENLSAHRSPVGTLGQGGLLYPDFLDWTRPLYAALIALLHGFGINYVTAGKLIATITSLAAIPRAFFLLRRVSGRLLPSLLAATLLATSFNLVVWGGFVLTEALGVLILLIAFERLFYTLKLKTQLGDWPDLLLGFLMALAILTRYEYAILLLPITALIIKTSPSLAAKLTNFYFACLFTLLAWFAIFPLPFSWASTWYQIGPFVKVAALSALALAIFVAVSSWPKAVKFLNNPRLSWLALPITGAVLAFLSYKSPGFQQFAKHDTLLLALAVIGFAWPNKRFAGAYKLFFGVSALLLLATYYKINPAQGRYYTHLLPVVVVPAALAAEQLIYLLTKHKNIVVSYRLMVIGVIFVGVQVFTTYNGMHHWQQGVWFKPGYEELSAKKLKSSVNSNELLLVATPEPYYLFTQVPTQSLADNYPYLYIDKNQDSKTVVIVDDMAMGQLFPNFDYFVNAYLRPYKTQQYFVNTPLRSYSGVTPENQPVTIYKLKLSELKLLLTANRGSI
jgi:hypothetical protein